MKNVPDDEIWETWESILLKTTVLGHKVADAIRAENTRIDMITVVPRGGLFITNIIGRQLGLSGDAVVSLGLSRFSREHPTKSGEFKIGQLPSREDVEGKVILLADEVNDTGETTKKAKDILLELGAKKVYTAAVHYKPGKNTTGEAPDFYVQASDGWIHYPWEVIDSIGDLYHKISNK